MEFSEMIPSPSVFIPYCFFLVLRLEIQRLFRFGRPGPNDLGHRATIILQVTWFASTIVALAFPIGYALNKAWQPVIGMFMLGFVALFGANFLIKYTIKDNYYVQIAATVLIWPLMFALLGLAFDFPSLFSNLQTLTR